MTKGPDQRKALGKGLSALLPSRNAVTAPATQAEPAASANAVQKLPIDAIEPNPLQPRSVFVPERLGDLAQSIRANGIIQPLIVRYTDSKYQLVAGERRWRAARLAGLAEVPVVVQDFATDRLLEVALIENIQREDLNPIEVAQALDRLAREHSLSHEDIGQRTGKDRTTVTNLIRLLRLPRDIQLLVAEHRISMGHARAILGLPNEELQTEIAQRAAAEGLSVRQVERIIQAITTKRDVQVSTERTNEPTFDPNVAAATRELEAALGTRVRIVSQGATRGRIEIEYFSADDLDRVYNLILSDKK
ncbi:MAG TPA: ParB/RepB/Spo0J family partition protein [Bryobacteraceae bacterium]|nr:ParB/RepB/Spo0J family partition protein [Bryobacteraceae bacterium]